MVLSCPDLGWLTAPPAPLPSQLALNQVRLWLSAEAPGRGRRSASFAKDDLAPDSECKEAPQGPTVVDAGKVLPHELIHDFGSEKGASPEPGRR